MKSTSEFIALYFVALEEVIDTKMSVRNLMDRQWFMGILRTAAADAAVTNYTSSDFERLYEMHTNSLRMFSVSLDLPLRIENWPPPDLSWTNEASGISSFIKEHGWSMETNEFLFSPRHHAESISGLPWSELSKRTFRAVTKGSILYVPLAGFGGESAGVAWNPKTNRFPQAITRFKPLGSGWYAWSQGGGPSADGDRRYQGQDMKNGQPSGGANGSQPFSSETNSTSSAAGSRR
ncbi:MAG TPA: hypothetical protein P5186_24965 [Candidatus Paceibacterota bacterium]|nr:hypothetical protein [Verrucomicrobiota bacterium]HRY51315.1 hypothetical protein [Candidatus Paceibacterota bacterium]